MTNAVVGSYIPVEDFLQLSVAFYDHFLLKMTHMPHTKKSACILGDKGEEGKGKNLFLVEALLLTSVTFCENTQTSGIEGADIHI